MLGATAGSDLSRRSAASDLSAQLDQAAEAARLQSALDCTPYPIKENGVVDSAAFARYQEDRLAQAQESLDAMRKHSHNTPVHDSGNYPRIEHSPQWPQANNTPPSQERVVFPHYLPISDSSGYNSAASSSVPGNLLDDCSSRWLSQAHAGSSNAVGPSSQLHGSAAGAQVYSTVAGGVLEGSTDAAASSSSKQQWHEKSETAQQARTGEANGQASNKPLVPLLSRGETTWQSISSHSSDYVTEQELFTSDDQLSSPELASSPDKASHQLLASTTSPGGESGMYQHTGLHWIGQHDQHQTLDSNWSPAVSSSVNTLTAGAASANPLTPVQAAYPLSTPRSQHARHSAAGSSLAVVAPPPAGPAAPSLQLEVPASPVHQQRRHTAGEVDDAHTPIICTEDEHGRQCSCNIGGVQVILKTEKTGGGSTHPSTNHQVAAGVLVGTLNLAKQLIKCKSQPQPSADDGKQQKGQSLQQTSASSMEQQPSSPTAAAHPAYEGQQTSPTAHPPNTAFAAACQKPFPWQRRVSFRLSEETNDLLRAQSSGLATPLPSLHRGSLNGYLTPHKQKDHQHCVNTSALNAELRSSSSTLPKSVAADLQPGVPAWEPASPSGYYTPHKQRDHQHGVNRSALNAELRSSSSTLRKSVAADVQADVQAWQPASPSRHARQLSDQELVLRNLDAIRQLYASEPAVQQRQRQRQRQWQL